MNNRKAVSPVVATALLLVVAVVSVVGFQSWFTTYSSSLFTDAEIQGNSVINTPLKIDRLLGETLYVVNNNENNLSVEKIEIDNIGCTLNQDLVPGINRIDVSSCLEGVTNEIPEVVVFTNDSISSKSFYVENTFSEDSGSPSSVVETDGNFQLLSTGIVTCSGASVGDTGTLDSTTYTAVSNQNLSDEIGVNNVSFYETACTSLVTDMNLAGSFTGGVFYNANSNPDISHWDTSSVTDMSNMFVSSSSFNQPLDFDTSSVTNMSGMFFFTGSFNSSLTFDTSSVTDMSNMFASSSSFNQPLDFDTSSVTNMNRMFSGASNFDGSITFTTGSVTDMSWMFNGASSFNQPLDFDTSSVTDMSVMFYNANNFNQSLNWDTNSVTNMSQMFLGTDNFDSSITFSTANVIDMSRMFNGASNFNQSLNFNTSSVTNMIEMFEDATSFDQDLTSWCVTNIGSEPTNFAFNSPLNSNGLMPDWGNCP